VPPSVKILSSPFNEGGTDAGKKLWDSDIPSTTLDKMNWGPEAKFKNEDLKLESENTIKFQVKK